MHACHDDHCLTHEAGCRFSDPSELEDLDNAARIYLEPYSPEALDAVNDNFGSGLEFCSSIIKFCTDDVRDLTDRQLKAKLLAMVMRSCPELCCKTIPACWCGPSRTHLRSTAALGGSFH